MFVYPLYRDTSEYVCIMTSSRYQLTSVHCLQVVAETEVSRDRREEGDSIPKLQFLYIQVQHIGMLLENWTLIQRILF